MENDDNIKQAQQCRSAAAARRSQQLRHGLLEQAPSVHTDIDRKQDDGNLVTVLSILFTGGASK